MAQPYLHEHLTCVAAPATWLSRASGQLLDGVTTWELRLDDGPFTVRADAAGLSVAVGAPEHADVVLTLADQVLLGLLSHQLLPVDAVAAGVLAVEGDLALVERLVELCPFT